MVCDGKLQEVVHLRKLPEGEWGVEVARISGARIAEQHDDGSNQLRANQAQAKFKI